jgi:hypothetical protein
MELISPYFCEENFFHEKAAQQTVTLSRLKPCLQDFFSFHCVSVAINKF